MDYWKPYGIHKKTLELYKVVPLSHYWLNGICFKVKDLTYAYDFGNGIYKIYAPLKDSFRFIFNGTEKLIQGIEQLTMLNNILVITKSLKDVMVLRELGIDAVAPQAESIVIPENIMNWFSDHYQLIITLMDYDNAGISLSCKMRRLYNTTPMFFTDKLWNRKKGYRGAKDISDFIKLHGKEELRELVEIRRRKIFPLVS
jgi:5S rRNA maturation endonuclease (ribonuclease M5)